MHHLGEGAVSGWMQPGVKREISSATDCESHEWVHTQHHERSTLLKPWVSCKSVPEVLEEGNSNLTIIVLI